MPKRQTYVLRMTAGDRARLIRLLRWNQGGPFFRANEEWCWDVLGRIRNAPREEDAPNGR